MADLLKPARTRIVEKALPKETESALPKVTPGGTGMTKEDGVPDNIYFEAGDGSVWEWNSNGEIHRAD